MFQNLRFFNKIILSSDSTKILNNINNKKIIKDKRPKKLSTKFAKTVDTINYLSKKYNFRDNDIIFIFEPTSPLRNKNDIFKAKKILDKKKERMYVVLQKVGRILIKLGNYQILK